MNVDEWINYVFPDVVNDDFSTWKYPDFYNEPIKDKNIICSYVDYVFLNIDKIHSRRNLNEIAYGLNYIVNPFISLTAYALLDDSVMDEKKLMLLNR
ncbi:hypothetical protein [Cellvibrio mixtus]|uniref:hypothetical protein n=1 Tax=Cellvibrio mixtus TaxID=39650 RepID=UPI00058745BD|nr:hypothetical protein [Cellvibrio mixtus]